MYVLPYDAVRQDDSTVLQGEFGGALADTGMRNTMKFVLHQMYRRSRTALNGTEDCMNLGVSAKGPP